MDNRIYSKTGFVEPVTPGIFPQSANNQIGANPPSAFDHVDGAQKLRPAPPAFQSPEEVLNRIFPDWLYKKPPFPSSASIFRDAIIAITDQIQAGQTFNGICSFTLAEREVAVLQLYGAKTQELVVSPETGELTWVDLGEGSYSEKFRYNLLFNDSNFRLQANGNGSDASLIGGFIVDRLFRVRDGAPPLHFFGPGEFSIKLEILNPLANSSVISPNGAKFIFSIAGYRFTIP